MKRGGDDDRQKKKKEGKKGNIKNIKMKEVCQHNQFGVNKESEVMGILLVHIIKKQDN